MAKPTNDLNSFFHGIPKFQVAPPSPKAMPQAEKPVGSPGSSCAVLPRRRVLVGGSGGGCSLARRDGPLPRHSGNWHQRQGRTAVLLCRRAGRTQQGQRAQLRSAAWSEAVREVARRQPGGTRGVPGLARTAALDLTRRSFNPGATDGPAFLRSIHHGKGRAIQRVVSPRIPLAASRPLVCRGPLRVRTADGPLIRSATGKGSLTASRRSWWTNSASRA